MRKAFLNREQERYRIAAGNLCSSDARDRCAADSGGTLFSAGTGLARMESGPVSNTDARGKPRRWLRTLSQGCNVLRRRPTLDRDPCCRVKLRFIKAFRSFSGVSPRRFAVQVIRGFSQPSHDRIALTIGNFDGVHRGHQAMLSRLSEAAEDLALPRQY